MIFIFLVLIFLGPRFATVFWWLLSPLRFQATFSTYFWPIIGIIFLPVTTLMYVIVYPGGLSTWDWIWLILAVMIDISSYAGGAYKGKQQMTTATVSPSTVPPPKAPTPPDEV